jgi:sugar/nucleoside kinase (ribokinase family)
MRIMIRRGPAVPERDGDEDEGVLDEVGAQDAFVAGMIYAMSRRMAPGPTYTPASGGEDTRPNANSSEAERGRWRLDECLR